MGSFGGGIVGLAVSMKDVMGALAVLIAICRLWHLCLEDLAR
jgi:hypothetical protein